VFGVVDSIAVAVAVAVAVVDAVVAVDFMVVDIVVVDADDARTKEQDEKSAKK